MCTALVAGNMIGSGVFLLPASLAPFGGISILGWLLSASGAVVLALTFARLSRLLPRAGGPYAYTRAGFGDFAGFLVAWGYWISIWVGNAAIAVAFAGYVGVFWPQAAHAPVVGAGVALAAIWALTWVNVAGVRNAGVVQLVTTALKVLPLIAIATAGLASLQLDHFRPFNLSGQPAFSAVTTTAALTLWALLGLESATIPASHVEDPKRTIPRATILGTTLVTALYILGTVAVMGVLAPAALAGSTAPFADAARSIWGSWAAYAVAAGAAVACFGTLNGWIMLQGQIPHAAARDGLFPQPFAHLSSRGTPDRALIVSSALVTLLMAANYTRGLVELFTFMLLLATMTSLVAYLLSSMAALVIAAPGSQPGAARGPVTTAIATLAFLFSLWAIAGSGKDAVFWGTLLLCAGVPVHVWIRRKAVP